MCALQLTNVLIDWYQNKIIHPWYLPSVNPFLSKITSNNWKLTPDHSTLVEGAHAGKNVDIQINTNVVTTVVMFVWHKVIVF